MLRPQEITDGTDFLARAYSKNVDGPEMLVKEAANDPGGSQHRAAQSPPEPAPACQDTSAQGSPSGDSPEIKVRAWPTQWPFYFTENLCIQAPPCEPGFLTACQSRSKT